MYDGMRVIPVGSELVDWRFPGYPCYVQMRRDVGGFQVRVLPDAPYAADGLHGGSTWSVVRGEPGADPWVWVEDVYLPGRFGGRRAA